MKKLLLGLFLIFSLLTKAQEYSYDSIFVISGNNYVGGVPEHGDIKFYYINDKRQMEVTFEKSQRSVTIIIDTFFEKKDFDSAKYILFFGATDSVDHTPLVASYKFVNGKLISLGLDDGGTLMVFKIVSWADKPKTFKGLLFSEN